MSHDSPLCRAMCADHNNPSDLSRYILEIESLRRCGNPEDEMQKGILVIKWIYGLRDRCRNDWLTPGTYPDPKVYILGITGQNGEQLLCLQYVGMPVEDLFFLPVQLLNTPRNGSRDSDYHPALMRICHRIGLGTHRMLILLLTASLEASLYDKLETSGLEQ